MGEEGTRALERSRAAAARLRCTGEVRTWRNVPMGSGMRRGGWGLGAGRPEGAASPGLAWLVCWRKRSAGSSLAAEELAPGR